jgi:hypothetical protein
VRALVLAAAAAAVFAVGVALGQALRERPEPSERTEVRTLRPGTVTPPPRTVTVTVTQRA